jgi:hypothetical protein
LRRVAQWLCGLAFGRLWAGLARVLEERQYFRGAEGEAGLAYLVRGRVALFIPAVDRPIFIDLVSVIRL